MAGEEAGRSLVDYQDCSDLGVIATHTATDPALMDGRVCLN